MEAALDNPAFARHQGASLAPIYLALLCLLALSALAFAVALWPEDSPRRAIGSAEQDDSSRSRISEAVHRLPADSRTERGQAIWM
jgi:hypothetical protein